MIGKKITSSGTQHAAADRGHNEARETAKQKSGPGYKRVTNRSDRLGLALPQLGVLIKPGETVTLHVSEIRQCHVTLQNPIIVIEDTVPAEE